MQVSKQEFACGVCCARSEHWIIFSARIDGYADLDGRLPGHFRREFDFGLQECPKCGFVGSRLTDGKPDMAAILDSTVYKALGMGVTKPAARLLRHAHLNEFAGSWMTAGYAYRSAAWIFDDASDATLAAARRRDALQMFRRYLDGPPERGEMRTELLMVMLDVARRSEQWDEAERAAVDLIWRPLDKKARQILEFEIRRIALRDTACYTVEQAMADADGSRGAGNGRRQ